MEPVLDGAGGSTPSSPRVFLEVFAKVFLEVLESNPGVMLGRDLFVAAQVTRKGGSALHPHHPRLGQVRR